MIVRFEHQNVAYEARLSEARSIAIPLDFDGPQPNHFGASKATRKPLELGGFVGSTRRKGSCNVDVLHVTPHCNGTHTESISHIVDEEIWIGHQATEILCLGVLMTVSSIEASRATDSYRPKLNPTDRIITASALVTAYHSFRELKPQALVIRTQPNDIRKRRRSYASGSEPAFFSVEAMQWIHQLGCRHLLVDLPSVDRMYDDGLLTNHHIFWSVPEGTHALASDSRQDKTITEMIFVEDDLLDGVYLLSLQAPALCTDAAPSRPLLVPAKRCDN